MPRDSNGNYTLPSGNPVVTGTTITSSWANTTLADLAAEMTDSLDRSGKGGMLAAFKLADGSAAAPAFAFTDEPTTGVYRAGGGEIGIAIGGVNVATITATTIAAGSLAATLANIAVSGNGVPANGMYLHGVNQLGFATAGVAAAYFDATQNLNLAHPLAMTQGGTGAASAASARTNLGIPAWSSTPVGGDLAQYQSSGYLQASYFNQTSSDSENPTIGQVFVESGGDGYLRKASIAWLGYAANNASTTVAADPGSGYPTSGTPGQEWAYY